MQDAFSPAILTAPFPVDAAEVVQVDWLIHAFSGCFSDKNTMLVRSSEANSFEPEYLPATDTQPAQICFAHGFFSSALHEISHWCIAGKRRRTLPDFGYWYAPDGRDAEQQAQFEQVEVKPQAIEWLFTLACKRRFRISLDNLNGDAGNGEQFKDDVYQQAHAYFQDKNTLPPDARRWFEFLQREIRSNNPVTIGEITRDSM